MTREIIDINDFIVLIEYSLKTDTDIDLCRFQNDVLGICFNGSGEVEMKATFKDATTTGFHAKGLVSSFFANNHVQFTHSVQGDEPMQCIVICCTLDNIRKLPEAERSIYEKHLNELIHPNGDFAPGPVFHMTGEMLTAVDKIFNTRYTGLQRILFLRSQVTELLAHYFTLLDQDQEKQPDFEEMQKLLQAKDILTQNMDTPPSLNELSKLIGLNSYKLKKNFKEMFGAPVFKFLQNERLDKAHDLLRNHNFTIQEAAWEVGYESISSFSNAFTKKYGFRPSELRA